MNDERLFCSDCGIEAGMLRIGPSWLELGHKRTPPTLHPVRLVRAGQKTTVAGANLAAGSKGISGLPGVPQGRRGDSHSRSTGTLQRSKAGTPPERFSRSEPNLPAA